jgi:hypothetical protein
VFARQYDVAGGDDSSATGYAALDLPGRCRAAAAVATDNNATDEVPGLLDELPDGRRFATVEEVWESVH